jgi:hypothetical protein
MSADAIIDLNGISTLENAGAFTMSDNAYVYDSGGGTNQFLNNAGGTIVYNGSSSSASATIGVGGVDSGAVDVGEGTLNLGGNGDLTLAGSASIQGPGSVSLTNGSLPGTLTVSLFPHVCAWVASGEQSVKLDSRWTIGHAHPSTLDRVMRVPDSDRASVASQRLNACVERSARPLFHWRTASVYRRSTVWNGMFSARSTAFSCPLAVAGLSTNIARNSRAAPAASVLRTFRLG